LAFGADGIKLGAVLHVSMVSKWRMVIWLVCASLILIGVALLTRPWSPTPQAPQPLPQVTPGPLSLVGEIVCLPHRQSEGPQTLECAYGVKADSSAYYGLTGIEQRQLISGNVQTGQRFRIEGTVIPAASNERYAIVGTVAVRSIEAE
jgi:hypothetical protein